MIWMGSSVSLGKRRSCTNLREPLPVVLANTDGGGRCTESARISVTCSVIYKRLYRRVINLLPKCVASQAVESC